MNFIPVLLGLSLWAGATAILCEDVFHSGHLSVTHALQPLLTAGTVLPLCGSIAPDGSLNLHSCCWR